MSSSLGANTRVHIIMDHNKIRFYLTKIESARREGTQELYLKGFWDDDFQKSQAFAYETATLIRRRFKDESRLSTRISFAAGNSAELIDEE